jgi:hypothetical protein
MEQLHKSVTTFRRFSGPFCQNANGFFPMATSTSCDSVCFESFASFVSTQVCPSQNHDRPEPLSHLRVLFDPDANKIWDCPMSEGKLEEYMKDLRRSLDEIHGKVKLRLKALGLPSEGMLTRSAQLSNWTKEITSNLLLLSLEISSNFSPDGMVLMKSLRLNQIGSLSSNIWSARLRRSACFSHSFFSDKYLNVAIRLQEQTRHNEWKFTVESFKDFREEGKEYQVLIRWLGIDEPVWEPMDIMCQDIPQLLRAPLDS